MEPRAHEILQDFYTKIRDWLNVHRDLGYTEVYSPLCNDEDRIRLSIALLAEHGLLGLRTPEDSGQCFEKNLGVSQMQTYGADRLMTQKILKKKDVLIELCTKAIVYAPVNSEELALAYGKRAEALLRVKLYEESIVDVERAFRLAYPPHLQAKLSLIKTKAIAALYEHDSLILLKSVEETKQYTKLMESRRRGVITYSLNKIINGKTNRCHDRVMRWNDEGYLPTFGPGHVENTEIPGASAAIAIRFNEKYGRHIIATRDIHVGEVLAVQTPYAAVLELDRTWRNCWFCLKQTWSGVPCDHCVYTIYCSEECRRRAWEEFHDIECPILGFMIVEQFDVTAVMSIRLLVKAWREAGGWEKLKEMIEEIESSSDFRTKGFTSNILDSTKYSSVYTLTKCTEKRSMEDLFRLSIGTATVTYILATMTHIFGEKLPGERDALLRHPWVVFAGSLLLKHAQIHAVNSQMSCEWDPKENESWARAVALTPLYGLINHRCNPSVHYTSHGNYMALHAISPIKKGEQIFDHRGVTFADTSLEKRQLQRKELFFFMCDCPACEQNWPLFNELRSYVQMHLPHFVKKQIDKIMCGHNIFTIMKWHPGMEISTVTPLTIATILEHLRGLYKFVDQPCREIEELKRTLDIYHTQSGSRCQSLDH